MRLSTRCSTAALLLIAAASAASAQTYWSYGDMARARGAITARPMMAGHNMAAAAATNSATAQATAFKRDQVVCNLRRR